jgi:hypothetical protein
MRGIVGLVNVVHGWAIVVVVVVKGTGEEGVEDTGEGLLEWMGLAGVCERGVAYGSSRAFKRLPRSG